MNVLKLILGLVLAAVLVVFGAQNTQSVAFHFIAWETPSVPVVLAIAIAVLMGVLLSWIVSVPGRFHGMRQRRSLQHEVQAHDRVTADAVDRPEATTTEDEPRS
ncbi:MAG: LapA family protein [Chloroflexi bacterium]|nr:LapA family protein [Chloroflexota bacterium]